MRDLNDKPAMPNYVTNDMLAWLQHVNSPEFKEEARKNEEENERARLAQQAKRDAHEREQLARLQPLLDALRAAGIELALDAYEGMWGHYRLNGGPTVALDITGLDAVIDDAP